MALKTFPGNQLSTAEKLPGKSLHVAIAIWLTASLINSATVRLNKLAALPFGLDRNAKYRALQWFEDAGLIKVERTPDRSLIVKVLELEKCDDRSG